MGAGWGRVVEGLGAQAGEEGREGRMSSRALERARPWDLALSLVLAV